MQYKKTDTPNGRNSTVLAAQLIRQLEDERSQLEEQVEALSDELSAARSEHEEELCGIFCYLGLRNTFTGEEILTKEDFYNWKTRRDWVNAPPLRTGGGSVIPSTRYHGMEASAPPTQAVGICDPPENAGPPPSSSVSARVKRRSRFQSVVVWLPMLLLTAGFIVLCLYGYRPNIFSDIFEAPSESDAPTSRAVDSKTLYVGSVNSAFIHLISCQYADAILEENRLYYKNISDALADGRFKCSVCLSNSLPKLAPAAPSDPGLVVSPLPANGWIMYEDGSDRLAPLMVKTSGTGYYLIRLRDHYSQKEVLTFFAKGGKEVEIEVPLGRFDISYSHGDTWYGKEDKFGPGAYCAKAEEVFDFYEEDGEVIGWTLTLYAVPGGDLSFQEISSDQF